MDASANDSATEASTLGPCGAIQGSCTVQKPVDGGTFTECSELAGYTTSAVASAKTECPTGATPGTWSDGPCDRTSTVGGCRLFSEGLCSTTWYYPPQAALPCTSEETQIDAGTP